MTKKKMVLEPIGEIIRIVKKPSCQIKDCPRKATKQLGCLDVCWKHHQAGKD